MWAAPLNPQRQRGGKHRVEKGWTVAIVAQMLRRALLAALAIGGANAQPRSARRLQAGGALDEKAILLGFKRSGNGAGLESWAAGSEPCGAGWYSWTEGWRGVMCDVEGGSVERMCTPRPFFVCVLHRLSALTSCGWAADGCIQTSEWPTCPASPRTSARWSASR